MFWFRRFHLGLLDPERADLAGLVAVGGELVFGRATALAVIHSSKTKRAYRRMRSTDSLVEDTA